MKRFVHMMVVAVMILLAVVSCATATKTSVRGEHPVCTFAVLGANKQNPKGVCTVPWKENAVEAAVRTGTIRFYFMSGEKQKFSEKAGIKFGDSCLVVFPNGEVMLIDAGMPGYAGTLVENLRLLGINKLDYIVLSHMHDDHYGAMLGPSGILANFEVGRFYWSGAYNDKSSVEERFDEEMKKRNVNLALLSAGDSFDVGDVRIDVYNPAKDDIGGRYGETQLNNSSIAMKMTYDEFSALFCGDLYSDGEYKVIEYAGDALDSDLVKANHHGRTTSNSKEWIAATTPRVVVATSGNPIDETVYAWYSKAGARVFNDNLDSYVRVVSDGCNCDVTAGRTRETGFFDFYDKLADKVNADSMI